MHHFDIIFFGKKYETEGFKIFTVTYKKRMRVKGRSQTTWTRRHTYMVGKMSTKINKGIHTWSSLCPHGHYLKILIFIKV